ncbi:MAG: hypothetical protein KDA42_04885 [Planctomycetales bacterium]|nr:hypothetical protein [Planctomycetales bacterium]
MTRHVPPSNSETPLDSGFLRARREAGAILSLWLICLLWCVGYCTQNAYFAYGLSADEVKKVWGLPHWVLWGVFLPWVVATGMSVVFSIFIMHDDESEADADAETDPGKDAP